MILKLRILRSIFIKYYRDLGYSFQRGISVVLKNDSLLFCNSGMIKYRKFFFTNNDKKYLTIQPCVRLSGKQNDLDEIGKSPFHHTSFEMLGIFQFNNVNINDIIQQANLFLIKWLEQKYLFYHYHPDHNGIRFILENLGYNCIEDSTCLWSTNENYCTEGYSVEIYYSDNNHNIEIWNMVFPSKINDNGNYSNMEIKLDMGAGLERLASVINKTFNNYQLLEYRILNVTVEKYYQLSTNEIYKITDHLKTITILLAHLCYPSNKGQGYILRRLLRLTFAILLKTIDKTSIYNYLRLYIALSNVINHIFLKHMYSYKRLTSTNYHIVYDEIKKYKEIIDKIKKIITRYTINEENYLSISDHLYEKIYDTYGVSKDMIINYLMN